ncbi:uncharacterized protein LOC119721113 [Patiria miniata]|uniref:Uncharacterized protein n=1 Tax=Patiria miniata TaxID=46514 RepID=A0A913Z7E7_PATMI|nr:uncharacterized protein LOC119721113 [Patiria miniata]
MKMPSAAAVKKKLKRIDVHIQGEDFKLRGLVPFHASVIKPKPSVGKISYIRVPSAHRSKEVESHVAFPKPASPYIAARKRAQRRGVTARRIRKRRRRRKRKLGCQIFQTTCASRLGFCQLPADQTCSTAESSNMVNVNEKLQG